LRSCRNGSYKRRFGGCTNWEGLGDITEARWSGEGMFLFKASCCAVSEKGTQNFAGAGKDYPRGGLPGMKVLEGKGL